jgi:hypothetical protein
MVMVYDFLDERFGGRVHDVAAEDPAEASTLRGVCEMFPGEKVDVGPLAEAWKRILATAREGCQFSSVRDIVRC